MAKRKPQPRVGGPRAAYRPKTRRVPLRLSEGGFDILERGTEETGLSASDYVESKLRGEDPRKVAARLTREEQASEALA